MSATARGGIFVEATPALRIARSHFAIAWRRGATRHNPFNHVLLLAVCPGPRKPPARAGGRGHSRQPNPGDSDTREERASGRDGFQWPRGAGRAREGELRLRVDEYADAG